MRNTYTPPEGGSPVTEEDTSYQGEFPVDNKLFNNGFRRKFETTTSAPTGKLADLIDKLNALDTTLVPERQACAA